MYIRTQNCSRNKGAKGVDVDNSAEPGPDPDDLRLTILPAPNCMTTANMQGTSKRMTVYVANSETNPNTDLQSKAARIAEMSEKMQSNGIQHSSSSTSSIDPCALKTQT